MLSARNTARAAAERCLAASGAAPLARRARRGDTLVLAYHNVVPHGEHPAGDASLHLLQAEFAAQLDILARTHDVVPLPHLLRPRNPARRPRAVITFDDAYLGAVTAGVRELAERGMPATFFVAPAFVPGGRFWWDALSDPAQGAPDGALRAHALDALRGRDAEVRRWAASRGIAEAALPAHAAAAGEAALAESARVPGITWGTHTWSHPNLARLAPDEVAAELDASMRWLRARFAAVVPWLSYPYGAWSPATAAAAREAGLHGALRIDGGWARAGRVDPFAVPRLNVPAGVSRTGFALRAAGVLWR